MGTGVVTACRNCRQPITWQPADLSGLNMGNWWSDDTVPAGRALCGRGEGYRGYPHDLYHAPILPDLSSPSQIEMWLQW